MMTKKSQIQLSWPVLALLLLPACAVGADRGNLDAAAQIHVPEGTPEVHAAPVPARGQRTRIAVEEVSRLDIGTYDPQFVERRAIAVTAQDVIAVLDIVTTDVLLYGPTEERPLQVAPILDEPIGISAAGNGIAVSGTDRIAVFDTDGRVLQQLSPPSPLYMAQWLPDGAFVGVEFDTRSLVRLPPDGAGAMALTVLPRLTAFAAAFTRHLFPREEFVVGGGLIYVTAAAEYEVAAFSLDGRAQWLLRAGWPRVRIPDREIAVAVGRTRRAGRAMGTSISDEAMEWPTEYPALAGIEADQDGRLYVFPHLATEAGERSQYPVDVYDEDGTLLVNGLLPFQGWDAAVGDSVYRIESRDGRSYVAEYRLQLRS